MKLIKEDAMRLSEALEKAGIKLREMVEAFAAAFRYLYEAASEAINVKAIIEMYKQPPEEALREVATGREWHLMKNAKKYRIRKKYRDRLIKRYYKETQTERRTKE